MGLGGKGKDVLHQRTGLTRVDVADVARGILAKVGDSTRGRPVIDVDCNNFIHVNSRNASDPVAHTANVFSGLCSCWASHEYCWLLAVGVKERGIQVGGRA